MPRVTYSVEHIIHKLREAEVLLAQGQTLKDICRTWNITDPTSYRWRQEYRGLKRDQAKRLKDWERENARLKRTVAALTLDKVIVKEAAGGGKRLRPTRRRRAVRTIGHRLGVAERHACQGLGPPRSTQRYQVHPRGDEEAFTKAIVGLARKYGR